MIDTRDLKARVSLLDLIGSDTRLRKIAGTRGGEYAGPCPFCGGEDRFRVQPDQGHWWCRGCSDSDQWSDAIGYLMRRDAASFTVATRTLSGDSPRRTMPMPRQPAPPAKYPTPSPTWQTRAEEVTRQAFDDLWSDRGAAAREYLHKRGLTDATLRRFIVGYIPADRYEDPDLWGVDAEDGKRVWLPRGIVLPWIDKVDSEVWCLKVRRSRCEPKYIAVKGSVPVIFGTRQLRSRETMVLPEGEFDTMLTWQEAGDLADVATLGSAGKGLDPRAALYMLPASSILVAYDGDSAGAVGAEKLIACSLRMRLLEMPPGQDITDYHLAGGDLRRLVRGGAE